MEHGESPRNPWNPATYYTETFPFLCFQQRVIPVLYSSPGLEQKHWYEHTHHLKKNKLNNTINAAPTKHRQRRRGCASCSALVERMHRSGSSKWAMRCFNKNRRARLQDHEWWIGGMDINTSWRCSVYSYQGLLYHVPLLQCHQEQVMIFFHQENYLDCTGIPGIPVNPLAPHGTLALGCQKPGAWRPCQTPGGQVLGSGTMLGQRPWRYPKNKVLVFVNASIFSKIRSLIV